MGLYIKLPFANNLASRSTGIFEMSDAAISDIIVKISAIAADHFNSPGLVLKPTTTAADVNGWDSIAHIQFMMRLEEELSIRFKTAEISGVRNVGELAERVSAHLK